MGVFSYRRPTQHRILSFLRYVFLVCYLLHPVVCSETDLTVDIPSGKEECFYHHLENGIDVELDFQVIDGGDLDIDFRLTMPSGAIWVKEYRKTESNHKFLTREKGEYGFCFDNSFSTFSNKIVFFEFITNEPDTTQDEYSKFAQREDKLDNMDLKIGDLREQLTKLRGAFQKIEHYQSILRAIELRDRSIQEDNFERVNFWSAICLFLMLTTGVIQVVMIRNLFSERSSSSTRHHMASKT